MTKYVAFLRGIGPGNPSMAPARLREACESRGFRNVQSVISSGNLVFESARADVRGIEKDLEAAWQDMLGFQSMTIVKSQQEIADLLAHDPFAGLTHGPSTYLLVTFMKNATPPRFELPHQPAGKTYAIVAYRDGVLFSVTDNTAAKTSDLMTWLEREFGKDITSRTWNTVQRIDKRFASGTSV